MTTRQLIDKEISANYNEYLVFCRRLYKGNDLYFDLMNESYLALTEMPEQKVLKFITDCKLPGLIKGIIYFKFKKRDRPNSLLGFKFCDLTEVIDTPSEPTNAQRAIEILKIERPEAYNFLLEVSEINRRILTNGDDAANNAIRQKVFREKKKVIKIYERIRS